MIKDLIQPILDLIKALVQPAHGSKFLITLAGIGAITYLHSKGIATDASDVTVAALAAVYYVADIFAKKDVKKQKNDTAYYGGNGSGGGLTEPSDSGN